MNQINEGGNIFKNPTGQPATQRINQADVDPTIAWLEKITGLPLQSNKLGNGLRKVVLAFILKHLLTVMLKMDSYKLT